MPRDTNEQPGRSGELAAQRPPATAGGASGSRRGSRSPLARPPVSWHPVRYLDGALEAGYPALEDWFARAYVLGVRWVEIDAALIPSRLPEMIRQLRHRLDRHELSVALVACAPDFTHPDPQVREEHYRQVLAAIEAARVLEAGGVRVTAGYEHHEVEPADGLIWCAELLRRACEAARRAGVRVGLENRGRARHGPATDFALRTEVFLEIMARLDDSPLGVCFNTASGLLSGDDPLPLLTAVQDRVWHVHVADRFPGQPGHTAVGEGAVAFAPLFAHLAASGYTGCLGLEDAGPEREAATERSLQFIRSAITCWWR